MKANINHPQSKATITIEVEIKGHGFDTAQAKFSATIPASHVKHLSNNGFSETIEKLIKEAKIEFDKKN